MKNIVNILPLLSIFTGFSLSASTVEWDVFDIRKDSDLDLYSI